MDSKRQPEPRFQNFQEQIDENGKAVGFKLPDSEFLFKYDSDGGWQDEKGNYYNSDGILQSDEDKDASAEEDDDSLGEGDEDLIDEFQQILLEEEGVVKYKNQTIRPKKRDVIQQTDELNFKDKLEQFKKKELVREELPPELFIYFKQKPKFFESIIPEVEKIQSVVLKNQYISSLKLKLEQKKKTLIANNKWLALDEAFLEFSGLSEEESYYQRYWYGSIKAHADQYLDILSQIQKSEDFNLLDEKTYYALVSKFYPKKSQKAKQLIKEFTQQVSKLADNQIICIKLDNLPKNFPLSFLYDLIDFAGGFASDIEEVVAVSEYQAKIWVLKRTALRLLHIEGYCYDRKLYVELDVGQIKQRKSKPQKAALYKVRVDQKYKIHERELLDTLALEIGKKGLAKTYSQEQVTNENWIFVTGSVEALRKILMFRGDSLIIIGICIM